MESVGSRQLANLRGRRGRFLLRFGVTDFAKLTIEPCAIGAALSKQPKFLNRGPVVATAGGRRHSGTVPYGDASLIAGSTSLTTESAPVAAAAPTAATSTSFLGTDPTNGATTILGIDWYWLAAGLGLIFVFTQKRGR